MAAITHPRHEDRSADPAAVGGAGARAAAVRSRGASVRPARPSLFAGDGQLRRPAPPVRLTSVPLVAHDDLAPRRPAAPARPHLVAVAEPVRTARPGAGSVTANPRPTAATYRRRRLVAATALFLGALLTGSWALGALGGGPLTASDRTSSSTVTRAEGADDAVELSLQPVSRSTYVVRSGDTLWSIARHLQPEGDVRPVVDALAAARQGRPLEVGETIVLP